MRSTVHARRWVSAREVMAGTRVWRIAAGTSARRDGFLNEDVVAVVDDLRLLAVLDGFGGISSGGQAATLALEELESAMRDEARLRAGLRAASVALARRGEDVRLRGLGASAAVALLGERGATVAHVGSCRGQLLRGGVLRPITRDHDLFRAGVEHGLSETEARALAARSPGVLTRWLGAEEPPEPDALEIAIEPGDRLVLTSDGVHAHLDAFALGELVAGEDLARAAERVLDAVPRTDDATVLLAAPGSD